MPCFSWREVVMVGAPLGLLTAGLWGPQWSERILPTKPRIVSCHLRELTPLELSLGAQVGLTVKAEVPTEPNHTTSLRTNFASDQRRKLVWYESHRKLYQRFWRFYSLLEEQHAFKWSPSVPSQKLQLTAIARNRSQKTDLSISDQFSLSTTGLTLPDAGEARQANFQVTKTFLQFQQENGVPAKEQLIVVHIQDALDKSQGSTSSPVCIGAWSWNRGSKSPIPASVGWWSGNVPNVTEVTIRIDFSRQQLPPAKGTTIQVLLSVNSGWPQEITFHWPEQISKQRALTEMKFTSQLAPLPSPMKEQSRLRQLANTPRVSSWVAFSREVIT